MEIGFWPISPALLAYPRRAWREWGRRNRPRVRRRDRRRADFTAALFADAPYHEPVFGRRRQGPAGQKWSLPLSRSGLPLLGALSRREKDPSQRRKARLDPAALRLAATSPYC